MKNTTGMWNLNKRKAQLSMKISLIQILSDPNNQITSVNLHNEIEDVPTTDLFDSRITKRFTGRKTLTIELYNERTDTPTTTGTAKRTKDSD